jgi:hypothetical protein
MMHVAQPMPGGDSAQRVLRLARRFERSEQVVALAQRATAQANQREAWHRIRREAVRMKRAPARLLRRAREARGDSANWSLAPSGPCVTRHVTLRIRCEIASALLEMRSRRK